MKSARTIRFCTDYGSIDVGVCSKTSEHIDFTIEILECDHHAKESISITMDDAEYLMDFMRQLVSDQRECLGRNGNK